MFLKYNGAARAIKLPMNRPGASPGVGGPDLQNFLVWVSLPGGDVVISLDTDAYPYAFEYLLAQKLPSGLPLWEDSVGPATVAAPVAHRPELPNAVF